MDVFSGVSAYNSLKNDSLIQALNYGGGGGDIGAAKTLLRSAVANAENKENAPDVDELVVSRIYVNEGPR